ncbi:MAG: hypothetical protein OYH77_05600 [Pseudomonadota bacterium]|nr:hypothetical protein [Pseudomonadota bacterium]
MRLLIMAILLSTLVSACKHAGSSLGVVVNSVRIIQVGDEAALTFNSKDATRCSVRVNLQMVYQCEKVGQDSHTHYANLGKLEAGKNHTLELTVDADTRIEHKINYRYKEPAQANYHYLRFDLQNKAGEILRSRARPFPQKTPQQGCKVINTTIPQPIKPQPLHLQRLISTGFASASASHHTRNQNVARISYSKLNFASNWDIYLMERQVGTRFILPAPAQIEKFSIGNTSLGSDLDKSEQIVSIQRGDIPTLNWKIKNPNPSILLTVKVARDDRSIVGECWLDVEQGMAGVDSSFWQRLTAGKYSIEAMLISPQRVVIQSDGFASAWQVNAYDWRYGYFSKT